MTHTEELAAPLVGRDDGQLQDAAGRAGRAAPARRSGTSTAASTPTCSAASRRRPRPRPPQGRRGGHHPGRDARATSPTWPCTSRASRWPSGCWSWPAGPGRVFFCNSGAEANEAAFKLSRLTGRPEVVTAEGAFHGRTMGALALTGQPAKADAFAPLPGGVRPSCPTATPTR